MAQAKPPEAPDIQSPVLELEGFEGLSVKIDVVNRSPSSWRRLENFDLFVPGSIRKVSPPSLLAGPFPAVCMTVAEYKASDTSGKILYGIGTDGKLYDLDNPATPGIDLGLGPILVPVFTALMPGVQIPFVFVSWKPSLGVLVGQAIILNAIDGNKYVFSCTTAGITNAVHPPTWPASGTIADGSVVWTNEGLADSDTFFHNYLAIVVPGFQPIKFDGVNVTDIGVSAPGVPCNIPDDLTRTSADVSKGLQINTGRFYSWTWWNPETLHESALAPVIGRTSFYSTDSNVQHTQSVRGSFLEPNPVSTRFYSQIGITIPSVALSPEIGDGYTHVRFYATQDGGSQLFLVQTLFDANGVVITDGNGAVKISTLATVQDYTAISITQSPQTCVIVYDGVDDGRSISSADQMPANNPLLVEGPIAFATSIKGTLGVDTDTGVKLSNQASLVTQKSYALNLGVNWSIEIRFRTTDNITGGPLCSFQTPQVGAAMFGEKYIWLSSDGGLHFAGVNGVGTWEQADIGGVYNDGNNHVVDVTSDGAIHVYVDGVLAINLALADNSTFVGYWTFGYGTLSEQGSLDARPGSDYFTGVIDEIALWSTTTITAAQVANNTVQALANANYGPVIEALTPTNYWRLDDLTVYKTAPTQDASLVFPSPALTDNFPPPIARWGAVFQGSLFLQDDQDPNIISYSDAGLFESFGEFAFIQFQTPNDDSVNSLIAGLNLLVISTRREVDSISGPTPAQFTKAPIDSLHGFQGKRCVASLGSTLMGQMRQGVTSLELNLSFGATGQNVQLGYGNGSLVGDDIQPITNTIPEDNLRLFANIAIDNTQNILVYAAQIS